MNACFRTFTAAIMLAVMAVGAYLPSAFAAFDSGTTIPVAENSDVNTDPAIDGSLVVYTSAVGEHLDATEIRYYDLATSSGGIVPGGDGRDSLPDVSGSKVVFSRFLDDELAIFAYDVESGDLTNLSQGDGGFRTSPVVGGSTVAWEHSGYLGGEFDSQEIFVYDLLTGVEQRLTEDDLIDRFPAVSSDGSHVVWQKCPEITTETESCAIWQAIRDGSGWTTSHLVDISDSGYARPTTPATNGDVLVYVSTSAGDTDIYYMPVAGGQETRLELPGTQGFASISGDLILFSSYHPDTGYSGSDLFVHDLGTGDTHQITDTPEYAENVSDIYVDDEGVATVVYHKESDDQRNIHAYVFNTGVEDITPPTLVLPADLTVNADSPDGAQVTFEVTASDDVDENPNLSCQPASGSMFPVGPTTVSCMAEDQAGNQSEGSFTVTILGAEEQTQVIIDLVDDFNLDRGTANSLLAKLNNATRALNRDRESAACEMLGAFINQVEAQSGKKLTADQADALIQAATQASEAAACS